MATNLDYSEQLIGSIDLMVQDAIDKASFDKTIKATIISCEDITKGKYLVQYQDSTFEAYTNNLSIQYNINSSVYILVPNGNLDNTKIILYGDTYEIIEEDE